MSIHTAMVLAAGRGLRMKPLTDQMPKPLIPVAGKPLVDYALEQLARQNISNIIVNTAYKAEMMQTHLQARGQTNLIISHEDEPLETGGGVAKALPHIGTDPFICMNSDTICVDGNPPALSRLVAAWNPDQMDVLMLLHPTERAIGFHSKGDFVMNAAGQIRRRLRDEASAPYVFTGIQILKPQLFNDCPKGAFSTNVIYNKLCHANGWFERIGVLVHNGDWLHVGDVQGLAEAESFLAQRQQSIA